MTIMRKNISAQMRSAIKDNIISELKPKRKRRTKKEMEAFRAAMQRSNVAVVSHISELKPKRKRRTKKEMEAFRAAMQKEQALKHETDKANSNLVTIFDAIDEKKNIKDSIILSFDIYKLKCYDDKNLCLYMTNGQNEICIGYYNNNYEGLKHALCDIAERLLFKPKCINKNIAGTLSNVQLLLDGLHKFEVYLSSRFLVKKEDV